MGGEGKRKAGVLEEEERLYRKNTRNSVQTLLFHLYTPDSGSNATHIHCTGTRLSFSHILILKTKPMR